jgi:hypothetical protein
MRRSLLNAQPESVGPLKFNSHKGYASPMTMMDEE